MLTNNTSLKPHSVCSGEIFLQPSMFWGQRRIKQNNCSA